MNELKTTKTTIDRLVPIKEAPKCLPFAEKTLRNWRCQGLYPEIFVKLGGKVLIDLDELERIIERQKDANRDQSRRLGLD